MQQRTGDIDAATLAARQLADRAAQQRFKIQQRGQFAQPGLECFAGNAVKRGAATQVFPHGQRLIQHGALKYNAQPPRYVGEIPLDALPGDGHRAAVLLQLPAENRNGG